MQSFKQTYARNSVHTSVQNFCNGFFSGMKTEDFPFAEFDKVDGTLLYDCLLNQKPDIVLNDYVIAFPQGSVQVFHHIMNAFMRAKFRSQIYAASYENGLVLKNRGHAIA